jgi:4-amino-4-deoxy-L-arabinose transferase-like glycosyltransferase
MFIFIGKRTALNTQYPAQLNIRKPFHISLLAMLLMVVCIPLFLHLDRQPIRLWDESRLAMTAYEMHKNGDFLVTHYEGEPDMWNTKPPLMIWLQVLFIKILGFSELAIRLPAAIAGVLTCAALVVASHKYFRNYLPGAFASVVLVTINGYVDQHAIRTGDYDGPLALFSTVFLLCSFLYAEHKNQKWLVPFFIALALAILTKSIQSLLFLPAIFIYYLLKGNIRLFFSRPFLIGTAAVILIVASYYLAREQYNGGYLKAIWFNELGGRYFNALEENYAGPTFYLDKMAFYYLPYWAWVYPVAVISGLMSKSARIKNLTLFTFIATGTYFIFISISSTKLLWYTVPMFPLMAMQIGIFIFQLFVNVTEIFPPTKHNILPLAIVSSIFIYPYYKIGAKVYNPSEYAWDNMYPISYKLKDAFHDRTSLNNHVIAYKDYDQHFRIYIAALRNKGQRITLKDPLHLAKGDTVLASEKEVFDVIEKKYDVQLIKNDSNVRTYLVK